jgi:hypothetical protein
MVLAAVAAMAAQARPDFSGTWVFDPKASEAASGGARAGGGTFAMSGSGGGRAVLSGGAGAPVEYHITQSDASLTMERMLGQTMQKFVHTFDGAENGNVNGRTTLRSRSRWDGSRLVTEGTQTVSTDSGDVTTKVREVRSLETDGTLVVETTWTTERGTNTTKQVYTRKAA